MSQQGSSEYWCLYTDGACRGNPGPSGAGWVILNPHGKIIHRDHAFLGHKTNNEAEYEAVILGMEAAHAKGISHLLLRADSELLVKQLNGIYRVKNPRIKRLFDLVQTSRRRFAGFRAEHVRREYNAEADREANLGIDTAEPAGQQRAR